MFAGSRSRPRTLAGHPGSRTLWRCRKCGRRFANRNQSHFCGSRRPLREHFAGKPREVRDLFRRVCAAVQACGPVTVLVERSRIAFHARMSFMAVTVQKRGLRGYFVFASVRRHPRFLRIETVSRGNHAHRFRISSVQDIDPVFLSWVAEAYRVGEQRHLG